MKHLFVLLLALAPFVSHAGDVGWGERGNGNEDAPPACKQAGDKIRPIMPRPVPEPRVKSSEGEQHCMGDGNPIDDDSRP